MGQLALQNPYLCRYYYGYNQYESVRQLQEVLNEKSHCNLSVDGYFGSLTEEAVKEYQRSNKLLVDGIVGPETLASLNTIKPSYALAPDNNYKESLLNRTDGGFLGRPIEDIGTTISSTYEGNESELIQNEDIEAVPLFKLAILYNEYDRLFGFTTQFLKPLVIADMTQGFYEYINSFGIKCSYNYNNYRDKYLLFHREMTPKTRTVVNTIRKGYYTLNIDVDYWLGAQIGKKLLPILQKARPIINGLAGFNISAERVNNLLHTANAVIGDIINLLRNQLGILGRFINNYKWLSGLVNSICTLLKRFIPVVKVVVSVASFAQLLLHIRDGDKENALEDLLTIVKDFIVGVATGVAVTALMAVGLGELAIAIVILLAILDYLFFNPDPDKSILSTTNLIAERVQ